jgi:hypothetical protein
VFLRNTITSVVVKRPPIYAQDHADATLGLLQATDVPTDVFIMAAPDATPTVPQATQKVSDVVTRYRPCKASARGCKRFR